MPTVPSSNRRTVALGALATVFTEGAATFDAGDCVDAALPKLVTKVDAAKRAAPAERVAAFEPSASGGDGVDTVAADVPFAPSSSSSWGRLCFALAALFQLHVASRLGFVPVVDCAAFSAAPELAVAGPRAFECGDNARVASRVATEEDELVDDDAALVVAKTFCAAESASSFCPSCGVGCSRFKRPGRGDEPPESLAAGRAAFSVSIIVEKDDVAPPFAGAGGSAR